MGGVTSYADYHYFEDDDFGINEILHDLSNADSNCISKSNNDLNMYLKFVLLKTHGIFF